MKLRKALSILLTICMVLTAVSPAFAEEIPAETLEKIEESVQQEETTETKTEAETAEIETVITEATESETVFEDQSETETEEVKEETESAADIVLTAELDDVIVTLNADADAFDNKGELTLKVTPVEIAESEEEALDAVEKENVAKRVTYDITVLDDGEVIEPVKEVKVSFELKDAPSGADGVNIYHHDEEEGIEQIAKEILKEDAKEETVSVSEEKTETAETETVKTAADKNIEITEVSEEELADTDDVEIENDVTVEATTDSFSLYTVDFTYKDKTISINGDTTGNKLDDIVDQLGIEEDVAEATTYQDAECTEEVTSGEVKEDGKTLFSVYEIGNEWYVDAVNAFDTEHGLVVKTADGAEYKIKVTDDPGETDVLHFLDWDDTQKKLVDAFIGTGTGTKAATYTVINSTYTKVSLDDGWYVVEDTYDYGTVTNGITVTGDVHLILKDGCNLTVKGAGMAAGICVTGSNRLTIYGQSTGENKGKLKATGQGGAGIGGGVSGSGSNITINGGTVDAHGSNGGAGIGGGAGSDGSNITINGGTVTANGNTGETCGTGIGGGANGAGNNITINGGKVTATGGSGSAGIGGGAGRDGSYITINGGEVTANGGPGGAGIGGGEGEKPSGRNITINGGTVTATGGERTTEGVGAGIGNGRNSKTSASDIKAAASVVVKAGASASEMTEISHTDADDLARNDNFKGKQYVTAEEKANYTVIFDVGEHGMAPDSQTIASGAKVTKPADPTELGYTFVGWYKESGCTNAWDFANDTVTAATTLYAKWTKNSESKSSGSSGGTWTSTPTSQGSSSAPINNGSWGGSTTGTWQYKVNGETLKNATAWISYTGADGKPYTGCFYFDKNGNMATGWQKVDNIWYFFDTTPGSTLGMMKTTGWITTDGKQYYVGPDGKMLANTTTPDGHKVDATGARID